MTYLERHKENLLNLENIKKEIYKSLHMGDPTCAKYAERSLQPLERGIKILKDQINILQEKIKVAH